MTGHVAIVGGSVAGLSLAMELRQRGVAVRVYERSSGLLAHEGAGLMMARPIMERLGLATSRPVRRRFSLGPEGQIWWQQNVEKQAIGWSEVYCALRRVAGDFDLHENCSVTHIDCERPIIHTGRFGAEDFDLVVGADGIGSLVRACVDPGFSARYLGYVAVRGLVPRKELPAGLPDVIGSLFDDAMAKVLLPDEHFTLYGLPGAAEPLNWMWYLNMPEQRLPELLTDANGAMHRWSLPAGAMPPSTEEVLRAESKRRLPGWMDSLVTATDSLFLQPVYAGNAETMAGPGFALVGDAAHLAVPHVGGGVTLALQDTLALADAFTEGGSPLAERLGRWQDERKRANAPRLEFAVRLGLSLQSGGKNWAGWSPAEFERWWSELLGDAPDDASR